MQAKLLDWDSQQEGWKAIKQRKANQKGSKDERYLLISDLKKIPQPSCKQKKMLPSAPL